MTDPLPSPPATPTRYRLPAVLGWAAGGLLAVSLLLPYWRARLFAPQYRQGLTTTMYVFKVSGDVSEIDELNHYIGMRKLQSLAKIERAAAVPAVLVLALLCGLSFSRDDRRRGAVVAAVAVYPFCFLLDMAFWMRWATSHLDPMAPLKLKPFSIPVLGVGRVAQFRSELWPSWGFGLAVVAAVLAVEAYWLSRERRDRPRKVPAPGVILVMALLAWAASPAKAQDLQVRLDAAAPGAVVELAAGRYAGPLSIAKPLTLRGDGRAVVTGNGHGTVITIKAPGVVLEGLAIENSGDSLLYEDAGVRVEAASAVIRGCVFADVLFGVFLVQAHGAALEGNRFRGKDIEIGRRGDLIRSWNSDRVTARGNLLEGGRDFVLWFSTGSVVEGNTIARGRYGLHFMYTNGARVANNRFLENSVGFYAMYSHDVEIRGNRFERHRGPSGAGLGLKESEWVTVIDNDFVGNRQGVYLDGSPLVPEHGNVFARNAFARNDIGLAILPGVAGNALYENAFDDNLQQVSRRGGGQLTGNVWSSRGRGNYWSDYAGYGFSGSAVGRLPYVAESAWENLMDRQPLARYFLFTPAASAVDLACRAFPIFRPKAVFSDENPLLRPPVDPGRSQGPVAASWDLPAGLASLSSVMLVLPPLLRRRRRATKASVAVAPVLSVRGLRKSFAGRPALSGVDLELAAGETVVLWGPNGAGKSTMIKCILGLYESEGEIRLLGRDARRDGPAARAGVGYAAQEFAGYDWTVSEAMDFIARLRGVEDSSIEPALKRCGLAAELGKRVCDLSGGMKQKLALAQALLCDPALLVLDEPCANLDAASRKDLIQVLRSLKGGRAILMTSHRESEVAALADRVLWLEEGRPARALTPAEFSRRRAEEEAEVSA